MPLNPYDYSAPINLPASPLSSPDNSSLYEDLKNLYNAVQIIAQQIDTVLTLTEDIRIVDATRGVILFDGTDYWRVTVNGAGTLVTANIGPILP